MTESDDPYAGYVRGELRAPSRIAVILPGWHSTPSAADAVAALAGNGLAAEVIDAGASPADGDGLGAASWTVVGSFGRLSCREADIDPAYLRHFAGDLSAREHEAADGAHLALELETLLGDDLLPSYRDQLRVLHHVAPNAIAIHDLSSFQWHPRSWWLDILATRTPPSPICLFGVHAVRDGDIAWLHTHGLTRGGAVELEVLAVPADAAREVAALLHHAALHLLDNGCPEPGEVFAVGRDLEICWQPWELATAQLPADVLGGRRDRGDPDHTGARGVLSMPGEPWRSAAELAPTLADEPLFWVSWTETQRMAMLAIERFPMFRELVQRFAANDDWDFLAKIGYRVDADDDEDRDDREDDDDDRPSEHLWFRVHAIDGAQLDATLLNQPYRIARLRAGDRGRHAADQLSDWSVNSPFGSAGPDRIGLIFDRLQAAADG